MSPRVRHWIRVILVSLGLTIAVALALGMSFEVIAAAREAKQFPQLGKSYNGLNLYCTGEGSPTVILESGMGVPAYGWFKVQPEVAKFRRVCSYDRAGYGWS